MPDRKAGHFRVQNNVATEYSQLLPNTFDVEYRQNRAFNLGGSANTERASKR